MSQPETLEPRSDSAFLNVFGGGFSSLLRWPQLDALWATLAQQAEARWYAYAVGETPPNTPLSTAELSDFIHEIDTLLHREHQEDYCGIVYADNPSDPRLIKIYDLSALSI